MDASGYTRIIVTEENQAQFPSIGNNLGTYYILQRSMELKLNLRVGETALTEEKIRSILGDNFSLHSRYGDKDNTVALSELTGAGGGGVWRQGEHRHRRRRKRHIYRHGDNRKHMEVQHRRHAVGLRHQT